MKTDKEYVRAKIKETAKISQKVEIERTIEVPLSERYVPILIPPKGKYGNGEFLTVFKKYLLDVAMYLDWNVLDLRMLLYFLSIMDKDNYIPPVTQTEIAKVLHTGRDKVNKSLKSLITHKLVLKEGNSLKIHIGQVNLRLATCSGAKTYKQKMRKCPLPTESDGITVMNGCQNDLKLIQDEDLLMTIEEKTGEILMKHKIEEVHAGTNLFPYIDDKFRK